MTTTTKAVPTNNSFDFTPAKSSTSPTTCIICKRLLYSFEETLACQLCHGAYHWRCVQPETISHYDENTLFICGKCNESTTTTATNPSYRLSNGSIKIKSPDSSAIDYRDFASIPSKLNTIPTKDTTVVNAIRYFEEKQQQQQQQQQQPHTMTQIDEFNEHLTSQAKGQYIDGSKTNRHYQEQQHRIGSDDDNMTKEMFQAHYQYTPLKEYAALRNDPTTIDTNTYAYQTPLSTDSDRQLSSRYGIGASLRYTDQAYEPTEGRIYETPLNNSTSFTSPTIDNITIHNRPQHFTSTTNLNVNDTLSRRQQQQQQNNSKTYFTHSAPYLSQVRDDDSSTFKSSYPQKQQQQYTDRHSIVGSDSGIVIVKPNHQHQTTDDSQVVEKKLTDLVQKLGRQIETDTQQLSEKLESKLKNLEHMINQQTFIIREQDEVIERLKTKIFKIETERDQFRERLSFHEQREHDDRNDQMTTAIHKATYPKTFEHDDEQQTLNDASTNRKYSNSSSVLTDQSKRSSKKSAAPRIGHRESFVNNENESTLAKLVNTFPANPDRPVSDYSSPSMPALLAASVPLIEKPAATNRLDDVIHQSDADDTPEPISLYYNEPGVRHHDSKQMPIEQQESITDVRDDDDDEQIGRIVTSDMRLDQSASSLSSPAASIHAEKDNLTPKNSYTLPVRNSSTYRSLESLPRKSSQTEEGLKPPTKTSSLEFNQKPVRYDDPGSIYFIPQEATHPASQYQDVVKGWLRKQNRSSIFKRVERYYCVLSNNTLLMHKHEHDRTPYKGVNLKGAKVLQYEDQKYGPSLELTWSPRNNRTKHYHLYLNNQQEAQQWLTGIQTAINNLSDKNKWQQYRINV
ncbi:unnamed protein product [Rotaria sp. Silwood1]|nr:unnamed protein product [Rotaria sp. Silwood1]